MGQRGYNWMLTIFIGFEVNKVSDTNVYDAQESLILFLELFLVEYLNCQYAVFSDAPTTELALRFALICTIHVHLKRLVPVWVQGLFDDLSRLRLLAINCCYRERIREA